MIAVNIGKKLLKLYNQKKGENFTSREFFEKVYVPLFFDHNKYMMTGGNSPLENPKIAWKKGKYPSAVDRSKRIKATIVKIETGELDMSSGIGFPASDNKQFQTTSGQIASLQLPFGSDELYCSWLGAGLGIGVSGALTILFNHPVIIEKLFEGWQYYRNYLNDSAYSGLRGNQINTWNGQWLSHVFSRDYRDDDPLQNFEPLGTVAGGGLEINTQSWTSVLFGIARTLPNTDLTGYVYSIGQTNKTLGFVPFRLPQIQRPIELYRNLFGENQYHKDAKIIEPLYGTAFSFQRACQMGAIGVQALKPKGLEGLIPTGKDSVSLPNFSKADQEKLISFRTYQTWLLAMLNNDELWDTAGEAAQALLQYEAGAGKLKSNRSNKVKSVLDTARKAQFMRELTAVVEEAEDKEPLILLGKTINSMPADNVNYFITLIRFRYAEFSSKPVQEPVK